jgi:hypothetical protein
VTGIDTEFAQDASDVIPRRFVGDLDGRGDLLGGEPRARRFRVSFCRRVSFGRIRARLGDRVVEARDRQDPDHCAVGVQRQRSHLDGKPHVTAREHRLLHGCVGRAEHLLREQLARMLDSFLRDQVREVHSGRASEHRVGDGVRPAHLAPASL